MSVTETAPLRAPSDRAAATSAVAVPTLLIGIFIISLLPPIYFFIGTLRLSTDRLLLLILFIPMVLKFVGGQAGRIQLCDVLIILFSIWLIITFVFHHGLERLNYSIISMVEILGAYLAGRVLVRSAAAYRTFMMLFLLSMLFLLPFGLVELFTNRNILQEVFGQFFPHYVKGRTSYGRMGLERVMAGFPHPILFGLFCSVAFASAAAVFGKSAFRWLAVALFVVGMTFMSLSSGPLIAIAAQLVLLLWGKITGGKWWLFALLFWSAYITVDLLSNRTPITIMINYITFNPATAWARVNIYTFGIREVWANPLFGIGLNDWARPYWLTGSVDNFWLLNAMRHGVPGFLFVFGTMLALCRAICKADIPSAELRRWRTGYIITVTGLVVTLCTVHIWSEVAVFVFFFLGAGMWFTEAATRNADGEDAPPSGDLAPPDQARAAPTRKGRSVGRDQPRYVRARAGGPSSPS